MAFQADAITRSCLPGDGKIAATNDQRRAQFNNAGNAKDNGQRFARELYECMTEASFTVIIKIGYLRNFSPSSPGSIFTKPFCSWESRRLCVGGNQAAEAVKRQIKMFTQHCHVDYFGYLT